MPGTGRPSTNARVALGRPAVWGALLSSLLGCSGVFTAYAYIAPQLADVSGFNLVWIIQPLLLFGAGLRVGNHLGGRLADGKRMPAVLGALGALAIAAVVARRAGRRHNANMAHCGQGITHGVGDR